MTWVKLLYPIRIFLFLFNFQLSIQPNHVIIANILVTSTTKKKSKFKSVFISFFLIYPCSFFYFDVLSTFPISSSPVFYFTLLTALAFSYIHRNIIILPKKGKKSHYEGLSDDFVLHINFIYFYNKISLPKFTLQLHCWFYVILYSSIRNSNLNRWHLPFIL